MDGNGDGGRGAFDWGREKDRLAWAVRVRWAVITGFLTLGLLLHPLGLFRHIETLVLAAIAGAAANALNDHGIRRGRFVVAVTLVAVSVDNALITWICARTGGFHSPLIVMYSVQVVATAMLVNARAALFSASLAALGGGLLALLEVYGETWMAQLFTDVAPDSARATRLGAAAWGVMLAYGLVLLVYVGGFLSDRLRRSERRLETRNRELADAYERLQQAEAQMLHTEKMRALGQLVAGVAHELNNPISFVSANIEHLRHGFLRLRDALGAADAATQTGVAPLLAELHTVLDDCEDGARRAKRIVAELRTFARADREEEWSTVDLNDCVRRTTHILRHHFRDGVRLDLALAAGSIVRGSAGQLEQVLLNIVVNAVDAVNGHGRVRIETRTEEEHVTLEVRDDGPGIPAADLDRIFEPFFTTKPVGQGTGVGLSLSYAIVRRHRGSLSVRSSHGTGAAFRVTLPREANAMPLGS